VLGKIDIMSEIFTSKKQHLIDQHRNSRVYRTHWNGCTGYIVVVEDQKNKVYIYGSSHDGISDAESEEEECHYKNDVILTFEYFVEESYTRLVKSYDAIEIFIGKSTLNEMTDYSGDYGDEFDGNSILLRIGAEREFRYVHIGRVITEFIINEPITKFVSSVGNNDVPYPYAESLNWCYCMLDFLKTPITDHEEREILGYISYIEGAKYESFNAIVVDAGDL
jgi:hypothetical protein